MARTHLSINAFILACVAALAISGTAACENTARGMREDAREADQNTRDERADARHAAREFGANAAAAADRVANAAAEAGEEVAERTGALVETIDVKAALMADPSVDATRIDVDTDFRTRTVVLNGYASTNTERDMAEVIARGHADGYRVVNNIEVRPRG